MTRQTVSSEWKPMIHRAEVLHVPGSMGQPISLDEYIERESRGMTAARLRTLATLTDQLAAKMQTDQARPHADLHRYTEQLVRILQSDRLKSCSDPLEADLAEAGLAAQYVLKGMDLIPDCVPEIGLTDDARVVSRVFTRHPKLMDIV
jgi:uncharacterized membrane protein YkvA (DUF1232 family)